jgi:hypothetical protein
MIAIDQILTQAFDADPKQWSDPVDAAQFSDSVQSVLGALEQQGIPYVLVGGIALLSYIDGRNTQDIDLVLDRSAVDTIPDLCIQEENKDFIRATLGRLQVDVLLTRNPLFALIQSNYGTEQTYGSRLVSCATVEGIILLKLYALPSLYRQGQFDRAALYETDILLLLLKYAVDTHALLEILKDYLIQSDLAELDSILLDIQARLKRTQRR